MLDMRIYTFSHFSHYSLDNMKLLIYFTNLYKHDLMEKW